MSRDQAPQELGSKTAIKRRRTKRGVREVCSKQLTLGSWMGNEWSAKRGANWGKGEGEVSSSRPGGYSAQRHDGKVTREGSSRDNTAEG